MGTLTRWVNFLEIVLKKKKKKGIQWCWGSELKVWMKQAWSQVQNYQSWGWYLGALYTALSVGMLCIFQ